MVQSDLWRNSEIVLHLGKELFLKIADVIIHLFLVELVYVFDSLPFFIVILNF